MDGFSTSQVSGNNVELLTTNKSHFNAGGEKSIKTGDPVDEFSKVLFNAVEQVNKTQLDADDLEQKMIVSPDQVNIHEVMITSEKARLSISFFKSITEKAIKAYNDIMMIR